MFEKKVVIEPGYNQPAVTAPAADVVLAVVDALGLRIVKLGADLRVVNTPRRPEVVLKVEGQAWPITFPIEEGLNAILEALGLEFVAEQQLGTSQRALKAVKKPRTTAKQ